MAATFSLWQAKCCRTTSQQCATSFHSRRWESSDKSMISVSPAWEQQQSLLASVDDTYWYAF